MALGILQNEIDARRRDYLNGVMVSVIIPVYNVENYLERCLNSVISQTFSNIEIICVDDGSTDRSGGILDGYAKKDSRIKVIHKENGGLSSARNAALSRVKGKYLCFVDSDDWLESNAIEELVSRITDENDIVVAGAEVEVGGGDSAERLEELKKIYTAKLSGRVCIDDSIIYKITTVVWSKLFKFDIIKKNDLKFLEGRKYEDNHFTIEYLVHSQSGYFVNKNLYHYVYKKNSIMNSKYDYRDSFYVFDYLYKRLDGFSLLYKYKNTISKRYSADLRWAYGHSPSHCRNEVMELATLLAQDYNCAFFNNDVVLHVKNREYGLVPQFDKDVLIVLKTTYDTLTDAFNTIKSLFMQSYKLPKILLMFSGTENTVKEEILKKVPKELENHVDKNLFIGFTNKFSLADIKQSFQDHVLITVKSSTVYSQKWLRCVMAAYSDNKDAFKSLTFDNPDTIDGEILFKDFAVIDVDSSGKATVLKSKQIIVSVTSYPARINSVALAIETMYEQTRKPDKVILWLAESQFQNSCEDLPKELLQLTEKGLEIQWCEDDLKPHKKYFYAFQKYPDALVITIDDDILYPPQRIENLYLSYLLHPHAVSAARAHLIPVSESGIILPYKLWPQEIDAYLDKPSLQLCATGCGGVLYPTVVFSKVMNCLLDKEIIKHICLNADDLWLKGMELVAGIPLVVAEEAQGLCYTPGSQDVGLWHENVDCGGNDRQLLLIEEEIDRRYGKGTFRKKLLDKTIGENLVGAEALSKLVSFYKAKANKQVSQVKQQYSKYSTLRVDIRNKGSEGSNVIEQSVNPDPVLLRRPGWLKDGITVESKAKRMKVVLVCQGDGELEIGLMGRDERNAEGMRYPVWIDCTYFAVNQEVIFNNVKTVCHDKRFVYKKAVTDGEHITFEVLWTECQTSNILEEYRQLQSNLKNANAKVNSTEAALRNANAKVNSTEAALRNANAKVNSTETALRNANAKISKIEAALKKANTIIVTSKKQILETKEDNRKLKIQIKRLRESVSFKTGRALTWLPRKLRGGVNCLKQNGLSYTVKRIIEHLGINIGTGNSVKKK